MLSDCVDPAGVDGLGSLREQFDRDGFVVLRQLLPAEVLRRLRHDADEALDSHGFVFGHGTAMAPVLLPSVPCADLFGRAEIVAAVKTVLGSDAPVFTTDAGFHRNVTSPWHKDSGDHLFSDGYFGVERPIDDPGCRIVRVGIYLQDHRDGSGLNVRRGSHKEPGLDVGEHLALDIAAGDVVLCNVLTTHRGVPPSPWLRILRTALRWLPSSSRARGVVALRRAMRRTFRRADRLAIFCAYGVPGVQTETYGARVYERQLLQMGLLHGQIDPHLARILDQAGIALLRAATVQSSETAQASAHPVFQLT